MVMDDKDKQMAFWKVLGCGLLLMVLTTVLLTIIGSVVFMRWSAPPPALRKYHKAADAGDAGAMTNIGAMYTKGHGVKQDHTEAMRWYRKAADKGEANAMFNIGSMYANGHGVKQDYAEAMEWFRKAADKGLAGAMTNIGVMYDNGHGVKEDYTEAMRWYRKAADRGDNEAKATLESLKGK